MTNVPSVIFDLFKTYNNLSVCRQADSLCMHRRMQICESVERNYIINPKKKVASGAEFAVSQPCN